ncbi:CFA20 protein, partial [Acromyrmex charruanus]
MLKNTFKYMSLLYSVANKPLHLWSKHVSFGGKVRRVSDNQLHGDKVIEITGPHDNTISTNITIPAKALDILNIKLPILILIVKNLNLWFKLEKYLNNDSLLLIHMKIIDKQQYRRRFSFMTYNVEKLPSINASIARIPLRLDDFHPSSFKADLSENIKLNINNNVFDISSNEYIRSKHKYVKEINKCIPSLIEKENENWTK